VEGTRAALILLLLLAAAPVAAGTIYKFEDAEGRILLTDDPRLGRR
jgi:hypothetical protein